MAYGVRTYTHEVGTDMLPPATPLTVITTDLPVYDYDIVKVELTVPVYVESVSPDSGADLEIVGRIGVRSGSSLANNNFIDFNNANVFTFKASDVGKIKKLTLQADAWSNPDINAFNAITLNFTGPYQSGNVQAILKQGTVIKVEITHTGTSACEPPTTVTAPQYIHYHGGLRVTWNAGKAGNKSPVTGYAVYRSRTQTGTYAKVGETDINTRYFDDYDYVIGDTWYYKVKTLTDDHNYDSALSARTGGTTALQRTTAPTIRTGAAGKVYNPRPRILLTLGTDALEEALTVTAENYRGRPEPMAGTRMVLRRISDLEPGSETVTVTNTDTSNVSYSADATVTVSSVTWTDDPIVAGETRIKAAHIMELRACLDDICDYYGLSRTDWGGDITSGVTSAGLWPGHMAAIQATARRIAQFINSWDAVTQEFGVTMPFFETVNRANAKAVNQMRQIITIL